MFIIEDQKYWDTYLDFIVVAYSTTPHENTVLSPHRLVYGEEMLLPLDIMSENEQSGEDRATNLSEYASIGKKKLIQET